MNHVQDAKPLSDHQKRTVRKYRLYSGVTVFLALSYKSFLTIKSIATSHDADLMYAWDQHTIEPSEQSHFYGSVLKVGCF